MYKILVQPSSGAPSIQHFRGQENPPHADAYTLLAELVMLIEAAHDGAIQIEELPGYGLPALRRVTLRFSAGSIARCS